jgi:hypothetical protein
MKRLSLPLTALLALLAGAALLRLASRIALHPPSHHALPLAMAGAGLLLAGAALGVRVGLCDRGYLPFPRGTRLTLLGGLTLGTAFASLGLLATLTALL